MTYELDMLPHMRKRQLVSLFITWIICFLPLVLELILNGKIPNRNDVGAAGTFHLG